MDAVLQRRGEPHQPAADAHQARADQRTAAFRAAVEAAVTGTGPAIATRQDDGPLRVLGGCGCGDYPTCDCVDHTGGALSVRLP